MNQKPSEKTRRQLLQEIMDENGWLYFPIWFAIWIGGAVIPVIIYQWCHGGHVP